MDWKSADFLHCMLQWRVMYELQWAVEKSMLWFMFVRIPKTSVKSSWNKFQWPLLNNDATPGNSKECYLYIYVTKLHHYSSLCSMPKEHDRLVIVKGRLCMSIIILVYCMFQRSSSFGVGKRTWEKKRTSRRKSHVSLYIIYRKLKAF